MSQFSLIDGPNPFATRQSRQDGRTHEEMENIVTLAGASPVKRGFLKASKTVLAYLLAVSAVFVTLFYGGRLASVAWVHRLDGQMQDAPPEKRRELLMQLVGLSPYSTGAIATRVIDPDPSVAQLAHDILREQQNQWTLLSHEKKIERHLGLVQALGGLKPSQSMRLARQHVASLLNQTIVDLTGSKDSSGQSVVEAASLAMGEWYSDSEFPAGVAALGEITRDSLTDRLPPLPVQNLVRQSSRIVTRDGERWRVNRSTVGTIVDEASADADLSSPQASRLRMVEADEPVQLKRISPAMVDSTSTPVQRLHVPVQVIGGSLRLNWDEEKTVDGIDDSLPPLNAYADASVMKFLLSPDGSHRRAAEIELIRRGYGDDEISDAGSAVHNDEMVRRQFLKETVAGKRDPRNWLPLMLDDPSPLIRREVISLMLTMREPSFSAVFSKRLGNETDPRVAEALRLAIAR